MKKIPVRKLTPANQVVVSSKGFKIRRVEDIVGEQDLVHDLHRHEFYFILAIKNGQGQHEIDFIDNAVHDNSIFFIRPGQVHQLAIKKGAIGLLAEFNTEFYHPANNLSQQRLSKAGHKNYCAFDIARFERLYAQLALMFTEYTGAEPGYDDAIRASLDIFFIEFIRQSVNDKEKNTVSNPYTQERFEEFIELLNKNITTHKQVSEYTGLMNVSAYQLNEITKSSVGKTASALIDEHIILEAKRYLLATTNQVKDIADMLGYEDSSYFIRFFKKHTQHSPEAFRHNFT